MLDFGVHGHIIGVQCIEWDTKVFSTIIPRRLLLLS